jgi:hypothetical protein
MESDKQKKIVVRFETAKNFQAVAATGAYGGPTPQGEIICNFFIERQEYPKSLDVIIDTQTGKFEEVSEEEKNRYVREIQVAVVMRPDIALAIGEWIVNAAKQVIKPNITQ